MFSHMIHSFYSRPLPSLEGRWSGKGVSRITKGEFEDFFPGEGARWEKDVIFLEGVVQSF